MDILLKDGVKYTLWTPTKELEEFEPMVKYHIKDIFGDGCEYFPKQKLKTPADTRSIPDGFVVNFQKKKWYIVELKLLCKDAINRISGQIIDYKNAIKKDRTKREIYKAIKSIKDTDFLDDLIMDEQPDIVVIINNLNGKLGERFKEKVKGAEEKANIIEFKTFARKNVDPKRVHIHLFEPLCEPFNKISMPIVVAGETIEVIGKTRKETSHARFDPKTKKIKMNNKGYSPSGAAKKLAGYPIDGWHFWKFRDPVTGKLSPIDTYRIGISKVGLQKVTAGEFKYKGNGIFVLKKDLSVQIDANKSTKEVIAALKRGGYSVTRPSSFYHQLRKKAGLLRRRR